MNTRANAAGRNTKPVENVAVTNPPEYEIPTEGANGVSAKVIDWPDTDRAPTIVEIAGVRFTRASGQITIIGRTPPGPYRGGMITAAEIEGSILQGAPDPVEVRRQARLDAIGDELEALIPTDLWDRASRLMGEADALWGNRVNDVHDYVLRHVGYALEDNRLFDLWRLIYTHLGPDDDKYRPNAAMEFLRTPDGCTDVPAFQERGGHW